MSASVKPSVAIVGRPNVGKSALFNRLVGRNIAIVHDQPGITRDRISAISNKGARPFMVWDTGGIVGKGESELTAQVRKRVEQAMQESALVLFVVDAQHGVSPVDLELARLVRRSRKPVILVINKIDDPEKHEDLELDFAELNFDTSVAISAAHGRGITELLERIDAHLPEGSLNGEAEVAAPALRVAVIGRPNAGKSSLINAIVRNDRAIVSEIPGTTRDAVDIDYQRGRDHFVFIDTAGIRRRGSHSSSVEVFSVMRAEKSIRRADLCILMIDLTSGLTAQDKRIAGMMQESRKPSIIVLNKWDLVKPKKHDKQVLADLVDEARRRAFFLDYAPVLVASAQSGENVPRLFLLISKMRKAAEKRIGTGILNRLLRAAFAANPPPMVKGRRLKLFYAAQASGSNDRLLDPPEFILFVNEPGLLSDPYRRYLEARIREAEPYPGLPVLIACRARSEKAKS